MDCSDQEALFKISGHNRVSPSIAVDINPKEAEEPYLYFRWTKLTYMIACKSRRLCFYRSKSEDVILKGLTGSIRSGQSMAIMGPSGCGKSTLLHCLSGLRKKGVMGEIYFSKGNRIKAAFIAQEDHLLGQLTVRESLIFASKIKNHLLCNRPRTEREASIVANFFTDEEQRCLDGLKIHQSMAKKAMEQLGLSDCANTKVLSCSGGQRKRLSIASELISRPDLLILDEPTSGLDSSSCTQCIQLLSRLANPLDNKKHGQARLAIIASIHQPSARVLFMFDQIYILSRDGQCIYQGAPHKLIETLSQIGLNCPKFHNPADFVIEIATGEYGVEAIMKLVALQQFNSGKNSDDHTSYRQLASCSLSSYSLIGWKKESQKSAPFLYHTWLLLKRNMLVSLREPMLMTLRLTTYVSVGVAVSLLYGSNIGKADGCQQMYWTANDDADTSEKIAKANENVSFLFFSLLFHLFAAMMPTVLTFPLEMSVFLKEHNNQWYSCSSYYIAKFLADTPFQIIFPSIYCSISYFLTGQIASYWRFAIFSLICCFISMLSQSIGLLIGALCVHDVNQAVFIAPITAIPVLLFCGFFVRTSAMPFYIKLLSYSSYMKFSFEAIVTAIYGFGRCSSSSYHHTGRPMPLERESLNDKIISKSRINHIDNGLQDWELVNSTYPPAFSEDDIEPTNPSFTGFALYDSEKESFIMKSFDLTDNLVYQNMIILISFIIFYRILTYFVFLYRAKQKL